MSSFLTLISFDTESSNGLAVVSNSGNSLLSFELDTLPLGEELTITYQARIDPNAPEINVTDVLSLNYSTINQEGIGVMVCILYTCIAVQPHPL